jgi:Ca-activated chloride channel family protein
LKRILATVLLTALAGLELTAGALQEPATFKSSVDLVPISAIVRDNRGRMVTTLTAADFEILDKGERSRILDFHTDSSSPVTVAVLVDVSGSMRVDPKLALAREVLTRLIGNLQSGRDEVGLFTFDARLHEQQPFTVDHASIDTQLTGARPFGSTSLYDAIAETARQLGQRSSPRRAIVVLTDGVDTSSSLSPSDVSGLASSIDVPVYVVATVPPIDRALQAIRDERRSAQSASDLRDLAFWTGGDLLWVTASGDASIQARQILLELRHQYLIAIESSQEREWRPIDVRVKDRRLTVHARSGYFSRENSLLR